VGRAAERRAADVSRLVVVPVTIGQALVFSDREHSHLDPPVSGLCAVGVAEWCSPSNESALVCVAILGRPISRHLQTQGCAEVTRVASDRTRPVASKALGAISAAGLALGWRRLVSSSLLGEAGASYRGAGWRPVAVRGPRDPDDWSSRSRSREAAAQPGAKVRWEWGPGALPRDAEVDGLVREMVGKIELPDRRRAEMPLFAKART
jgi:hypothetical protein